jgi:hypothetical protein
MQIRPSPISGNVEIVALQTAEESGQQGSLMNHAMENLYPSLQFGKSLDKFFVPSSWRWFSSKLIYLTNICAIIAVEYHV